MSVPVSIAEIVPRVMGAIEKKSRWDAPRPSEISIHTSDTSMANILKLLTAAYDEGYLCVPPLAKVRINGRLAD